MATQPLRMSTARRSKAARERKVSASAAIARALQDAAKQQLEICEGSVSSKSLHNLRVACRRAEAALRLAMGFGKHRDCKKLIKRLQAIRDACNPARDDDVLRHWLRGSKTSAGKDMVRSLKKRRSEILSPVVKAIGHARGPKEFDNQTHDLMESVGRAERKEPVQPVLGKYLLDELARFVSRLDIKADDESTLHHLRIAGKRLRYGCEFAKDILGDAKWTPAIKYLQQLQDRLGAIHDQAVGEERLRREKSEITSRQRRALGKKVTSSNQRLQHSFWQWWQSHSVASLVSDLSAKIVALMQHRL